MWAKTFLLLAHPPGFDGPSLTRQLRQQLAWNLMLEKVELWRAKSFWGYESWEVSGQGFLCSSDCLWEALP
jgi:hypothetical protein